MLQIKKYQTYLKCVICKQCPSFLDSQHVCVSVAQSRPTLCNPMDYRPPGSSVHGVLQARILEQVAIPFSRGSSQISRIAGRFFTILAEGLLIVIQWTRTENSSDGVRPAGWPCTAPQVNERMPPSSESILSSQTLPCPKY